MDWLQIAQSLGVPMLCLAALAFAVWKGITWIGKYVLIPLSSSHIDLVNKVSNSVESIAGSMKILSDSRTAELRAISETRAAELKTTEAILKQLNNVAEKLEIAVSKVSEVKDVVLSAKNVTVMPSTGS